VHRRSPRPACCPPAHRRAPLRASAYAAIVNTILDPLLIFKPPVGVGWGVGGAAAATVVAQGVAFASLFRSLLPWLQQGPAGVGPSQPSATTLPLDPPAALGAGPAAGALIPKLPVTSEPVVEAIRAPIADASERAPMPAPETATSLPLRLRRPRLQLQRQGEQRSRSGMPAPDSPGQSSALRTISATLLRSSAVLGTWVYITSAISRRLGADAIAAHGVLALLPRCLIFFSSAPPTAAADPLMRSAHRRCCLRPLLNCMAQISYRRFFPARPTRT
jgi:hypothetical protein